MDKETTYFLSLISAFINRQEPQIERDLNWEQVYNLSKIHSVSGIIYLMVKKLEKVYKPDTMLLDMMKKDFSITFINSVVQNNEAEIIIEELNNAKIPHVFLKGFVLKNFYPMKELRTMGDIDFLIKPEDREKTHSLMLDLGYEEGNIEGQVWDYIKGIVRLEVHTQIMYHNISNGIDYVSYFKNTWSHVRQKSKSYTYELTDEYHFLFLLVHMAKHFDYNGCGIRMIMDIAMYMIYFRDRLDWNYINVEIEKLDLVIFTKNILILCNLWFGVKCQEQLPSLYDSFYRDLSHYILSAGTFGVYERNIYARLLRKEYSNDIGIARVFLRAYRKIIFPNYKDMYEIKYYSFLKNRPFLLPISWIYRVWRCILFKGKSSVCKLIDIAKSKKEADKQYEILNKLGL